VINPPKPKFDRREALAVAREMVDVLKPCCEPDRLKICGSLRRGLQFVHDIEVVFVPRFETRQIDFFTSQPADLAHEAIDRLLAEGVLEKRTSIKGTSAWGPLNKFAVHRATGIAVDFFATSLNQWWISVVIRTGPAAFNTQLILKARQRGFDVHTYSDGLTVRKNGERVFPQSEPEVFQLCGLPYLEPDQRRP